MIDPKNGMVLRQYSYLYKIHALDEGLMKLCVTGLMMQDTFKLFDKQDVDVVLNAGEQDVFVGDAELFACPRHGAFFQ